METKTNNFIVTREFENNENEFAEGDILICKNIKDLIEVTITPAWPRQYKKEHSSLQKISAERIAILNLNHTPAYGHIYTETLPEIIAVDETYQDYNLVLIPFSDLVSKVVKTFALQLSKKIQFVHKEQEFILKCKTLKVINHYPQTYPNKQQNIKKLKSAFHAAIPIAKKDKDLLLYCTRRNKETAKHGRKLEQNNEDNVIQTLMDYAKQNNLEFYLWDGTEPNKTETTILKQYELFSSAKLVVAMHGGALCNLIFLDPSKKPKVIEFSPYLHKWFNRLSGYVFSKFSDYHEIVIDQYKHIKQPTAEEALKINIELSKNDSTIDIDELKKILYS